jgi:hypothetical protein
MQVVRPDPENMKEAERIVYLAVDQTRSHHEKLKVMIMGRQPLDTMPKSDVIRMWWMIAYRHTMTITEHVDNTTPSGRMAGQLKQLYTKAEMLSSPSVDEAILRSETDRQEVSILTFWTVLKVTNERHTRDNEPLMTAPEYLRISLIGYMEHYREELRRPKKKRDLKRFPQIVLQAVSNMIAVIATDIPYEMIPNDPARVLHML